MLTHDSDSSASEATLRRGVAAARAGLRSVAAAQFERAAENLPDDPNVWLWLAWVANSPDNTIRCLERVLELSPGHEAATAGLTWARGLSQDMPQEPAAAPMSVTVAASLVPIVPVVESTSSGLESAATNVELAPVADIANEVPAEPMSDTAIEPRLDSSEATNSNTELGERPEESALQAIIPQPEVSPVVDATRRRWSDLVQQNSEPSTDAAAWPSLVPPPLPSLVPPPLPTVVADAPAERAPLASSRFHGMFTANPVAPAEPTPNVDPVPETNADVEALTESFNPPTTDTSADGRPLVMVVDDSPTVRKLVSLTLERRGYRVISAFDGVAAIKELGSCRPDLILLDINMPRLDGYRLCKLIKKHEATQSIPVVMLSGKDGMFDKLRGRLVGCSDYITKPFEADALTHKVAKYLTSASSSL